MVCGISSYSVPPNDLFGFDASLHIIYGSSFIARAFGAPILGVASLLLRRWLYLEKKNAFIRNFKLPESYFQIWRSSSLKFEIKVVIWIWSGYVLPVLNLFLRCSLGQKLHTSMFLREW